MLIQVGYAWARVKDASPEELDFLRTYLTFTSRRHTGECTSASLLTPDGLFPAGLSDMVVRTLRERGTPAQRILRALPGVIVPPEKVDLSVCWPHQRDAIMEVLQGRYRGVIQHATGCLSGDTIIELNRKGWSFKLPLRDLAVSFNGGRRFGSPDGWDLSTPTTARFRSDDGHIRLGEIKAVYASGVKTTYTVLTASGHTVRATMDHRFKTENGWKRLSEIVAGDRVWVASGYEFGAPAARSKKPYYKQTTCLRLHPFAGRRNIRSGYTVPTHMLVMESALNGLQFSDFVARLIPKSGDVSDLIFLDPKKAHVHHRDGNTLNNELSNLEVLAPKEHHKQHGEEGGWRRITETTELSPVLSIVPHGEEETFDIEMVDEPHNFMASGFVVHNSGKGTTISVLCKHIIGRILVVVPSKQLLIEMCDRLAKHGIKAGRVGDGRRDLSPRVVVCIAASLKTLKKHDLEGFVAVLVDEAHGVPSPTILEPLMRCVNAAIRLGFSGTPMERADKKSLYIVGVLGEVIHRFTPAKAVDRGIVARCRLRMVPLQHPFHPANGRYDQWERRAIVRNKARNLLLARLVSNSESPRIVFVRTKEHQAILAKLLGVDCLTVNDETPSKQVKSILEAFKAGSVGTLISTPIFRQGVDIPEVNTVINGAGGKATIDVIQKVGRGSRRFQADGSTKDEFRVYDIDDRGCGCGGAHKSCIWLERHSEGRNAAYLKFGYVALSED